MQNNDLPSEDMAPGAYSYDHVRQAMTFPSEELLCGVFDDKSQDVGRFIDFSKVEERSAEMVVAPQSKHQGLILKVSSQAYNCFFARFLYIGEDRPCDLPRPALQLFNSCFGTSWDVSWLMDKVKSRYAARKMHPIFLAITDNVENLEHAKARNKSRRFNIGTIHPDGGYQCKLPHADDVIIIWMGSKLELPYAPRQPPRFDPSSAVAKRVMHPTYGLDLPQKDFAGLFHGVDTEAMDRDGPPEVKPTEILWEPRPEDTTYDNEYGELRMKEGCDQWSSALKYKCEQEPEYY